VHTLNGIDNVGGCNSVWSRFSRILNYITYAVGISPKISDNGIIMFQLRYRIDRFCPATGQDARS